jgi:hypothetical protein
MAIRKSPVSKWTDAQLESGASRNVRKYENVSGSLTKRQRASASDTLGMVQREQAARAKKNRAK